MWKILLRVFGLLLAAAAPLAAWYGFEAGDVIRGLDNNITVTRSEMASNRLPRQKGEERIAAYGQQIAQQEKWRHLWFVLAVGALVVGVSTAVLPLPQKRKVPADHQQLDQGEAAPVPLPTDLQQGDPP